MLQNDDVPILTVVIREEGGYFNIYEIDSSFLIAQHVSRSGAITFCEENFLEVREDWGASEDNTCPRGHH